MCFGPKHFFKNPELPLFFLQEELAGLKESKFRDNLYDYVGQNFVRVNLRPYRDFGLSLENLVTKFLTSTISDIVKFDYNNALSDLKTFLTGLFSESEINAVFQKYLEDGSPAVSHSQIYKDSYFPAYRLIESRLLDQEMKLLQIQNFISRLPSNQLSIIALEGGSCSGKTTISNELSKRENITVIHVDDFFDNSNDKIGINSSRILEEIIMRAQPEKPLSYRRFDCTSGKFIEEDIEMTNILIIEGVYSANLSLRKYYNAIIFLEASESEQISRLKERSNKLFSCFLNEWIPREKRYFERENVYLDSDLIV
jgi:uridine kinase